MSIEGKDIANCIEFMTKVYTESAELFKSIEAEFNKNRWKYPLNSSTVYWDGSASINHPQGWLPRYLSRYFVKPKGKLDEVLGVTLTYNWDFHEIGFNEPMLCCSRIKFNEPINQWKAAWFVIGGFNDYCNQVSFYNEKIYYGSKIKSECVWDDPVIDKGTVSGYYIPLVSIKDSKDVEKYIIKPLLALAKDNIEECSLFINDKAHNLIL